MAADYRMLSERLTGFYDFSDKTVLYVGAGGGRLLGPSATAKQMIAIDHDADALAGVGLEKIVADFNDVQVHGDVVYFEFCLHEMADPLKSLEHARTLAPEIVVFDHAPDSEWAYFVAEDGLVIRSAAAMTRFGIRHHSFLNTEQKFASYAEFLDRVKGQGEIAIQRAGQLEGRTEIKIPMNCELALL